MLEVDRTPITDIRILKLKGLLNLRVLKAYGNRITDKSVAF